MNMGECEGEEKLEEKRTVGLRVHWTEGDDRSRSIRPAFRECHRGGG